MIFSGDQISQKLGAYLKQKREDKGFSQKEISESLGYSSPQFVSNIERGICSPPMPVLKKLMKLYKISARELTDFLVQLQREHLRAELSSSPRKKSRA